MLVQKTIFYRGTEKTLLVTWSDSLQTWNWFLLCFIPPLAKCVFSPHLKWSLSTSFMWRDNLLFFFMALVWEDNFLVFLFYHLCVLLNVLGHRAERHKGSEILNTYLRVSLEILRKEEKIILLHIPQSQNSKLAAVETSVVVFTFLKHSKKQTLTIFISFCKPSLIIFFVFHPLSSLLPSSVNLCCLCRARVWFEATQQSRPSVFCLSYSILLFTEEIWRAELHPPSSHTRTLKSIFQFISQLDMYLILKSPILLSEDG